jgi:hypothetical protein
VLIIDSQYVYSWSKTIIKKYSIMGTEKTKLYCIYGLIKAFQSSATDKKSHVVLTEELKKHHIPETINVITEESFRSIMAERCAEYSFPEVIASIVSKYDEMEFTASIENCTGCGAIPQGGL